MGLNQEIKAAFDWRYATKKYDSSRPISDADWATLEESLIQTPTSFGLQPIKFVVVENPELRQKLREVSWGQSQITDASKLVVFLNRDTVTETDIEEYMQRVATTRGIPSESLNGFRDMLRTNLSQKLTPAEAAAWTRRQSYIALGFLIETAALLRIDATPIEGFDPAAYDKILGLENSGWKSSVVATLGYRHAEDGNQSIKKVRKAKSEIIQYR